MNRKKCKLKGVNIWEEAEKMEEKQLGKGCDENKVGASFQFGSKIYEKNTFSQQKTPAGFSSASATIFVPHFQFPSSFKEMIHPFPKMNEL